MKFKKLNLNKYSFLDFLKSDFYAWILNDENYLNLSCKYKELKDLDIYRWYRLNDKDKVNDLIIPSQVIDGEDAGEWAKDFYEFKYPNLDSYDLSNYKKEEALKKTEELLKYNDNYILFEGAFLYNDFLIRADVIIKKNNKIKLLEVKAVTVPLYYHALDIMFQYFMIKKLGYDVESWIFRLSILNGENYFYEEEQFLSNLFLEYSYYFNSKPKNIETGKKIDLKKIIEDYKYFSYFNYFDDTLIEIKKIQRMNQYPKPILNERAFKGIDSNYESLFLKLAGVPEKNSIFEYSGDSSFSKTKKSFYFNKGIKKIEELDNEYIVSKNVFNKITEKTKCWILNNEKKFTNDKFIKEEIENNSKSFKRLIQKYFLNNDEIFDVPKKIKNHLNKYKDVIYMFDFETISQAIPRIKNTKVYEQVPYQYSIHIILDKNDFDWKTMKNIIHLEWLASDKKNIYDEFWKNFLKDITKFGIGTYVSYNKSFEKKIIKNRIERSTSIKEMNLLEKINKLTIDLMEPFSNKWFYVGEFKGSYSIKKVGPYFVPELNYQNLDSRVRKGDQSAKQCKIWLINNDQESNKNWLDVRSAMLEYCKYDTLIMVGIFQEILKRYS